ncbi:MetQ/NlpA family ABC transporter substrate-binding protein [Alkaliphilus peptidifermentans]|uniref:Lipoprotein n=1 Tax=Alkaliphilus peptidifermentans DSM 18978 TaxID=1120976 RepID=A0A1G5I1C7_9FIRM|nr:MetQ/NlpA family ABC transporter substrate-binding protein [Alkaliphilus peptidifermentans]SCY69906.1 D-methionine transport system substrate-binding protein [Alkaliphilus peptidifermentans DSM 18978]
MKRICLVLTVILLVFTVIGCGAKPTTSGESSLKIGVTGGPHEQVAKKVQELAAEEGLSIELVVFNEYIQPNIQLFEKQLDVNIFQHEPYLIQFNADRNMDLITIAPTVNFPMGIYSNKISSPTELQNGDKVAVPNDATNQARALILLETSGVIKLKEGIGTAATVRDIVDNPKELKIVELEAPMLIRALPDVAVGVINTNFIIEAGMNPVRDSIFIEDKNSPWVNYIVTRPELKEDERIKKLVEVYHSDEVRRFIENTFQGSIVPAF